MDTDSRETRIPSVHKQRIGNQSNKLLLCSGFLYVVLVLISISTIPRRMLSQNHPFVLRIHHND